MPKHIYFGTSVLSETEEEVNQMDSNDERFTRQRLQCPLDFGIQYIEKVTAHWFNEV